MLQTHILRRHPTANNCRFLSDSAQNPEDLLQAEIRFRVVEADVFDYPAQEFAVVGELAVLNVCAEEVAEYPAGSTYFVAAEAKERA